MIRLEGGSGRLYAGYRVAIVVSKWQVSGGGSGNSLGERSASGTCIVHSFDHLHAHSPITRASLRIGNAWWTWNDVKVDGDVSVGGTIAIYLTGDPDVIVEPTEPLTMGVPI